jgi:Phosphotransferase System HPr (HPr) Family
MVSQSITVKNEQGLHMRPAGMLVKEIGKLNCDVVIDFNGKKTNAKSVLNIIAACIKCGSEVTIECSGPEEEVALSKAISLIESGFGE